MLVSEGADVGGEVGFAKGMINDSKGRLKTRVTWHSLLLGKRRSLKAVLAALRQADAPQYATTTIALGASTRWAVAWTMDATQKPLPPHLRDAKVFGAKKRLETSKTAPKRLRVDAKCGRADLYDRVVAFLADFDATVRVERDTDGDAPKDQIFALRATSRTVDVRVAATPDADAFALALSPNPDTAPDVFSRLCDALPGEVARSNRRWRRKLKAKAESKAESDGPGPRAAARGPAPSGAPGAES